MKKLLAILILAQAAWGTTPSWVSALTDNEGRTIQYHCEYLDKPASAEIPGYWKEVSRDEQIKESTSRPIYIPGKGVIERGPVVHVYLVFQFIPAEVEYHGNVESMVYHKPGCRYYDCGDCTDILLATQEAIDKGYRPCGICKPDEQ